MSISSLDGLRALGASSVVDVEEIDSLREVLEWALVVVIDAPDAVRRPIGPATPAATSGSGATSVASPTA